MAIEKIGFTSGRISALVCKAGQDQTMYRDAKTPCLGLRITKSGVKSFIFETWCTGNRFEAQLGMHLLGQLLRLKLKLDG